MNAVSLFSGVEGFGIGFSRAGIETVLQAEQDPRCLEVLARHYPTTKRVTDVRYVNRDLLLPIGDGIDLVYGGFPCQDLSMAGKRAGLNGTRSSLWFEFKRVLRHLQPRWCVIENVPGLLSSNQGRDFAVIIDGLDQLGFDVAWAVLDAQHFGVPQRRRRVFVVAGPRGRGPEQVLSLCEGCGGNPAPDDTAGKGVAGTLGGGAGERGWSHDTDQMTFIPIQDAREIDKKQGGIGIGIDGDPMFTLDRVSRHAIAVSLRGREGGGTAEVGGLVSNALRASAGEGVAGTLVQKSVDESNWQANLIPDIALALQERDAKGPDSETKVGHLIPGGAGVRRLTPRECERLMGWPDDWTRWTATGREISDTSRYRMIGNGVVAPVAEWIGHRLVAVERLRQEVLL